MELLNISFEPFDYERIAKHFLKLEILPLSNVQKYFWYSKILITNLIKISYSTCKKPKCLSKHINFPKFMQHPFNGYWKNECFRLGTKGSMYDISRGRRT